MAVLRKSIETGAYDVEFRIRRRDTGEVRWMYGRGEVTFDAAGQPVRMLGINVDITDRKLAGQPKRRARSGSARSRTTFRSLPGWRTQPERSSGTTAAGTNTQAQHWKTCADGAGASCTTRSM